MSSLAEAIASLTNPIPKSFDPEDDANIDAVTEVKELNEDTNVDYEVSELRSRTAPLLEDVDPKYAGRKVSKKSLEDIFHDDEDIGTDEEEGEDISDKLTGSSENENSEEDDTEEDLADEDLDNFKKSIKSHPISSDKDDSDKESSGSETSNDNESDNNLAHQFSNIDVTSEIEKGKAIKAQQELWNRLCECRIKLQKCVIIANKLPQFHCWENFKARGGAELTESLNKAQNKTKSLLNYWLELQAELLQRNPETTPLNSNSENNFKNESLSDEEILSDSDVEIDQPEMRSELKQMSLKRKFKNEEYGEELAKRHKSLTGYRNSVIQKWDEKTRLATGRMTQKSFMAFDNSALKQIEQILQDKNRLIKRTQLKRSIYRVLGKQDIFENKDNEEGDNLQESIAKQDMLLKDYDPEIFDDDDFYRQLLKEVIESKSVNIDPITLRKQMEIQKTRNKMKRKVDTKASKGRRLRYDVHPKMVNFMAPIRMSTISDEARDNLLKCFFGKSSAVD